MPGPVTGATFDVDTRRVYLNELRTHGQRGLAAEACGVSLEVINKFKKFNDPDGVFAGAEKLCLQLRSETITRRLESEFIEGILEPKIDKEGNLMYWNRPTGRVLANGEPETIRCPIMIRKVESAARLRVLERHDTSYREHKEIDVNSKSGVLVVPQVAGSLAEWQEAHGKKDGQSG